MGARAGRRGRSRACIADFDSASAMLRALSACLHGEDFANLGMPAWLRPPVLATGLLPQRVREAVYAWSGWAEAISAARIGEVDAEEIARWVVDTYPERRYPAVAIGSSSGALVHLCAALGIPWLPQTFLVALRQTGVPPDHPRRSMAAGVALGQRLLAANPDLQLHHMHDPNQDQLMVRHMTYFRIKRLRLGRTFEHFLADALAPGGTILLSECSKTWPATRVGERHVFQFGAVGGLEAAEYFAGGPRVAAFLERYGSTRRSWDPPEPDGEWPEAEWGFEAPLRADVLRFAGERGYQIRRLIFDDPEHLSPPVAELYRSRLRARGLPAERLLVESFALMAPRWALRSGSVPFWLTFNTEPSAACLERYLDQAEPYDEILMMLFAHGTDSIGLASIERWRSLINRARGRGIFLGVDERSYPRDFATFARYHSALPEPSEPLELEPLAWPELEDFIQRNRSRFAVRWLADAHAGAGPDAPLVSG
jgi:hypothetical protein